MKSAFFFITLLLVFQCNLIESRINEDFEDNEFAEFEDFDEDELASEIKNKGNLEVLHNSKGKLVVEEDDDDDMVLEDEIENDDDSAVEVFILFCKDSIPKHCIRFNIMSD